MSGTGSGTGGSERGARRRTPGRATEQRHARRLTPAEQAARAATIAQAATPEVGPARLTFTTRAAVLALALCAALLTVAYPLRAYLAARSQVASQQAKINATQAQVDALAAQHAQAAQPKVVESAARNRLHYAYPGEQNYIVVKPAASAAPTPVSRNGNASVPQSGHDTWYGRLLRSDLFGPVTSPPDPPASSDLEAVARQLGRRPRGVAGVAHWCRCRLPDVVATLPELPDGTPFPTAFYLTCPRAVGEVGRLEGSGLMRQMTERLATDAGLAARYRTAHEDYLHRRDLLGALPAPASRAVSAGGMPDRVKCLHVLVAHALAAGPGVNPFGDEALALLPDWSAGGPCVDVA